MENPITQYPIPESAQPVNQTPVKPVKVNNFLVLLLSVLLAIAVIITGLFYFQIQKLSKELSKYQSAAPIPSATPIANTKCVEKSSLNCEKEIELSFECTEEYQNWARANCPSWKEKVYCKDPRPEVCTMECIQTPPYICGSDGKSYCSVCQACSNKDVNWYEMKTSPCEEQ